ncbi:rubredoxin-like domain-containing protein [Anaerotignum faecicola]
MCLNCGFIFEGKEAPQECPVCQHDRGFFIRLELAPYTAKG